MYKITHPSTNVGGRRAVNKFADVTTVSRRYRHASSFTQRGRVY